MFTQLLKTAYESGTEVLVQPKQGCCDPYQGRIQELHEDHFSLFQSGPSGGVLWVFRHEDISFCGMLVDLPSALTEMPPETDEADIPCERRESER